MIPEFRAEGGTGNGGDGRATASREHYPEPTQTPSLPVWTDELGREIRLHTGLDHPPQDHLEALVVMLFGVHERRPDLLKELIAAASRANLPTPETDSWERALKAVWKHRASVVHPDAHPDADETQKRHIGEAFKCLQTAKRILDKSQGASSPEDVRSAGDKGVV